MFRMTSYLYATEQDTRSKTTASASRASTTNDLGQIASDCPSRVVRLCQDMSACLPATHFLGGTGGKTVNTAVWKRAHHPQL